MARISTERIWTITGNDLGPRVGRISLDSTHVFINDSDTLGPLPVNSGLKPADVAVFLGITRTRSRIESELTEASVGYLVTQVNPADGSGILVSGELMERHPPTWLSEHVVGAWGFLMAEGYSPSDLGLNVLNDYLVRNIPTLANHAANGHSV